MKSPEYRMMLTDVTGKSHESRVAKTCFSYQRFSLKLHYLRITKFVKYLNYSFQISEKIQEAKNAEIQLNNLKINLFPLARRATELFCILRSLAEIRWEYQFSLNIFNNLFDEALNGKSPPDFGIHPTEKVSVNTRHSHYFHI